MLLPITESQETILLVQYNNTIAIAQEIVSCFERNIENAQFSILWIKLFQLKGIQQFFHPQCTVV